MAYKSKYSGEEVEGLLDKVNDGGTGEGITDIQPEATAPLNLDVNIAGSLATITGSIDHASEDKYGTVTTPVIAGFTAETAWQPISYTQDTDSTHYQWYKVYLTYDNGQGMGYGYDGYSGLAVQLPWVEPLKMMTGTPNNVEYVLCIDSDNRLRKVPISSFISLE